jgi:hypothetical protein
MDQLKLKTRRHPILEIESQGLASSGLPQAV